MSLDLPIRPRRNRKSPAVRALVCETELSADHFILPLFVKEGGGNEPIDSMPGCQRLGPEGVLREVELGVTAGVRAVILFPVIDAKQKTRGAEEAWNDSGLVPQTVRSLKNHFPDVVVITDVALDPYNSDGHDGLVSAQDRILNDETVEVLCQQARCHARAGADIVAPSDMMDGRVAAIRSALDAADFREVSILSYAAKYASAFYGPFRGALDSAPRSGDKKTYQMDPANAREALREAALDEAEGADMIMVKPAGPYLDVIAAMRKATTLPVAAYQVSGEFLMIKAAAAAGWLEEKDAVLESLLGIRRAGATVIVTYFARQAAEWLHETNQPVQGLRGTR
ncbi:MAG: porphobilinogen synthase [Verrucomicrobiales bacterium]